MMNEQTKIELLKIAAQYACTSIYMSNAIPLTKEAYVDETKTFLNFLVHNYEDMMQILDNPQ